MTARAQHNADQLFTSARAGSSSCLGQLLALYTNYLKLLVSAQLDNRLRVRVSPSDIVQESFFEAHRDFAEFRGKSMGEFVVWLRRIVVNNILRVVEQHVHAEKRDVLDDEIVPVVVCSDPEAPYCLTLVGTDSASTAAVAVSAAVSA